jgi:hypothetical protein
MENRTDFRLDGQFPLEAGAFVQTIEKRQDLKVAYRLGYIDEDHIRRLARRYKNEYGKSLLQLVDKRRR